MPEKSTNQSLGLENSKVTLSSDFADWKAAFDEESRAIRTTLDYPELKIEHIGSTAIKGLVAKPILDIMIGIESFEDGHALVGLLEELGYDYRGENGIPGHHYCVKESQGMTTHHLHMVSKYGNFWKAHILFRDYLQTHAEDRDAYADLKISLAQKYPNDRAAYTDQKAAFIGEILAKSGYEVSFD